MLSWLLALCGIFLSCRPSVLDNFALLSGQLNSLGRLLKSDRMPALRNYVFLPLELNPERDVELEVGEILRKSWQ